MNRLSSRLRAPKLPSVHDLPVITSPNKHIVTFKKQYPSGPQIQQVRLKYPYMSAQTLADSVSLHCQTNKSSQVLAGLTQALGNVATGKLARPVTGIKITIGGVTHVEKNKTTVVQFMRGSLALGNRDKKKTTRHGKMGIRTTQVTLCSAAFPF
ncbi:hypothetical protein [Phaffia rhodozyma]|uniref:Uncharacterized protein n=1 Tax=Phaffia rhodozyma TaxID=264483 RepID=A0A0F7SR74_PHARH|nr:hypothetical protein [Phaffia rhodozyma]